MGEVTQEDRRAAEAIIDDLTDRKGLRHEFDNIDVDIQDEIKETWAGICAAHRELGFREGVEASAKVVEESDFGPVGSGYRALAVSTIRALGRGEK